jgi:hypothetical protein
MTFLAFPRFVFDELAERVRPYLPRHDLSRKQRYGRRRALDYKDLLAIGLRSLRVDEQWKLSIDFCLPQPRVSEALAIIKPVLAAAVREWPAAEVRMLTLEEGREIWESMLAQHGIPEQLRAAFAGLVFAYSIDG